MLYKDLGGVVAHELRSNYRCKPWKIQGNSTHYSISVIRAVVALSIELVVVVVDYWLQREGVKSWSYPTRFIANCTGSS